MANPNNNQACATRLAAAGLFVFPVKASARTPIFRGWRKRSSNDAATVAQWWQQYPNALPALDLAKCGLVVLDGDRHGASDGVAALRWLVRQQTGFDPRGVPMVRTPRDGVHLFFKQSNPPFGNSRGALPEAVDVRGHGGLVLAPGAELPDGRGYRAISGHPELVEAVENGGLPDLPAGIAELIRRHPQAGQPPPGNNGSAAPASARERAYGKAALRRIAAVLAQVVKGTRNQELNRAAFILGGMLARGWLIREEAEAALTTAMQRNGYIADKGARAVAATIASGLGAGTKSPHEDLPEQGVAAAASEDTLALLFAEQHDGHFVFDHTRGEWFRWDDQVWRRDADEYVLDCTRALIRSHKLGRIRTATSVERAARTDRRLARDHTAWNADPLLLGTPGDVVDLRDGELLAPDAAYMVNMSAGVRPAPQGAPHPLWTQFLKEATCNDADLQRYLKQRAGYWLTGDTSLEDFDFFYGPGGNGKGVFLKTIAAIMDDYALVAPISQFMVSRHDEHLCELARLAHARLVIASEPEENRSWAIGKIKQLTGNEGRIAARHMHQNFFEFLPRFKLVFVGNTKPRIASVDEALVRRLNLVPFQFRPATRDEQLKEKLVIEYPAILRWAVDGWLDLKANGRCRPAVIASATKEYLDDENVIAAWLDERCELGRLHEATLKNLFADWKTWCEDDGEDPETNKKLKRRLEKLQGLRFSRGEHGVIVKGIGLKP
jgi:putative DNA primase/helicase